MSDDDDQPATKTDLNHLRTELHGEMAQLRTDLHEDMDQLRTELNHNIVLLRDDLIEKMRDIQTEVLRAFHGWASPIEIRLRSLPNIEERLGLLEERVSIIERRENLN